MMAIATTDRGVTQEWGENYPLARAHYHIAIGDESVPWRSTQVGKSEEPLPHLAMKGRNYPVAGNHIVHDAVHAL